MASHAAQVDQPKCPHCGSAMAVRLGEAECENCGKYAGATAFENYEELDEHLHFSRQVNVTSKWWCFGLYALPSLLPTLLLVAVATFIIGIGDLGSQDRTLVGVFMLVAALSMGAIFLQLVVFYFVLFSDVLWLKWVGLAHSVLQVLVNAAVIFVPELVSRKDHADMQSMGYEYAAIAWMIALSSLLGVAYAWWLTRLLWTDIRGLQLNRKLRRHFG